MGDHRFQVNLRGIIELLSDHLYSGPQVFVRELLQNGVDAIAARSAIDTAHAGELSLELIPGSGKNPATLAFEDNGIGLSEGDIHQFISTIGASSKRGDVAVPADFIGQFGIGLLSCFVVCDEIVMVTRSAKSPDAGTFEWRGKADGTYAIRHLESAISPGTRVYLRCKPGAEEFFKPARLHELVTHFGGLLPVPIYAQENGERRPLNAERAPWRKNFGTRREESDAILNFGKRAFDVQALDWIPLRSTAGAIDGVAFVLPYATAISARHTHRVYLKNMLLSERADNLLPHWAFFVKCVVNAGKLRPTASRESFYEDTALSDAREELGGCIRNYLVRLAESEPEMLRQLMGIHYQSIKALAAEDDEFFRIIADWLPFQTSAGTQSVKELRQRTPEIKFARTVDEFRQIASVATAQGMCVVNAGYAYDHDLLEKLPDAFADVTVREIAAADLVQSFEDLSDAEHERAADFLRFADRTLRPFQCATQIKRFAPAELPALYSISEEGLFRRSLEMSKDVANAHWAGLLNSLGGPSHSPLAELCFNFSNPLVQKLVALPVGDALKLSIEMLYVQSMLLGHRPLRAEEMQVLNRGLLGLIELGIQAPKS